MALDNFQERTEERRHRVKCGLDHFLDHFIGWKHTISTQVGVGCSLLVLREGWEAECYYSGRGERRTFRRQGGVRGGCKSNVYDDLTDVISYLPSSQITVGT